MEERIQIICENICDQDIQPDEQLIITKVLDSFKIMDLICSLEEEFHIQFRPEEIMELEHFSSVNRITDLVTRKMAENV